MFIAFLISMGENLCFANLNLTSLKFNLFTFLQFVGYYNCVEDKAAQLAYMMLASNDIMHFSLAFVILKSIFGECNQT